MWQLRVARGLNRRERENFSRHPGAFRYKTPIPRHKSIRVGAFSVTRNGREWCILIKVSLRFLIVHVKRIDHVFCATARKMTLFRYSLPFPTSTSLLAYIQPKTRISRLIGAAQGRARNCSKISERKRDLECPDRILYLEYSNHKVS